MAKSPALGWSPRERGNLTRFVEDITPGSEYREALLHAAKRGSPLAMAYLALRFGCRIIGPEEDDDGT